MTYRSGDLRRWVISRACLAKIEVDVRLNSVELATRAPPPRRSRWVVQQ
jgi:hypothetical protein